MARDDGAPAKPACPQHAAPKQNRGDRRTAYQPKATFGRMPVLSFPVARSVTEDWQMAGQECLDSRSGNWAAFDCVEIDLPIVRP